MSKRSADTFADHESVPPGALPFFVPPRAKRVRSGVGVCGAPPSPPDPLSFQAQDNSSSSDEMSDAGAALDQADNAVSAHHLATTPGCSSAAFWLGSALPAGTPAAFGTGTGDCAGQALGVQTPPHCPDARLFLEQLAACMLGCQVGGSVSIAASSAAAAAGSLGTALWHAFAELNVVLARQFSELPTSMLRGYHSFTRAPRAELWFRFAASQRVEMSEEHHAGSGGAVSAQRWLVLTRFLLEHVLAGCPTASCVMYTIEVPAWLRGWCARWGHPAYAPLRVLALFAYEAAGAPAPRALYVPCFELLGC